MLAIGKVARYKLTASFRSRYSKMDAELREHLIYIIDGWSVLCHGLDPMKIFPSQVAFPNHHYQFLQYCGSFKTKSWFLSYAKVCYPFFHCTKIWRGRLSYFTKLQHTPNKRPYTKCVLEKGRNKNNPNNSNTQRSQNEQGPETFWPQPPSNGVAFRHTTARISLMRVYRLENTGRKGPVFSNPKSHSSLFAFDRLLRTHPNPEVDDVPICTRSFFYSNLHSIVTKTRQQLAK